MQEVGKENMFTFGVDAEEVDKLREERKNFKDYDPRWKEAFKLIYDGKFGDKEYFKVVPGPLPPPPPSHPPAPPQCLFPGKFGHPRCMSGDNRSGMEEVLHKGV